jgi:hypothetical protein
LGTKIIIHLWLYDPYKVPWRMKGKPNRTCLL